jgi:hypothetical protein
VTSNVKTESVQRNDRSYKDHHFSDFYFSDYPISLCTGESSSSPTLVRHHRSNCFSEQMTRVSFVPLSVRNIRSSVERLNFQRTICSH